MDDYLDRTPPRGQELNHCRCGCHGAAPRPQFVPTPATLRQLEAELDRYRCLSGKLARFIALYFLHEQDPGAAVPEKDRPLVADEEIRSLIEAQVLEIKKEREA